LQLAELTPDQRKKYERNNGVVVRYAVEGSPAFNANIIPGDLIIGIDNNNVLSGEHAGQLLEAIPQPADKVVFKVIRNNIEKDIVVSLTKP
jgi:S1-C subfamily serine protease